jgi:hypothetical protein
VQAYCDPLEVRCVLSERAGMDVGDEAALDALAHRSTPLEAAAAMAIAEAATSQLGVLTPQVMDDLDRDAGNTAI